MAATGNKFFRNYLCHVVPSETKPLANSESNFLLLCKNAIFSLEILSCMAEIHLFDNEGVKQCGEYNFLFIF